MSRRPHYVQPGMKQRPLDLGLIRRLFVYTRPHARLRNALLLLVVIRAMQLPAIVWATASIISGPVADKDWSGTLLGVLAFVAFSGLTEYMFVYRMRFALRLGEAVVQDLRNEIYRHLLRMPISYFKRTQVGRLIGRITADVDVVRVGVQDVFFVSAVQAGNLIVSAALMVYYDWKLFLIVLVMAPVLWLIIRHFRFKLGEAYRAQQESFSRVTASLAESVSGIREIQGFVRQDVNGGLFGQLIHDHSRYNMDAARQSAVFQPLLEFNGQLFLSALIVVGGYRALGGQTELQALIQFLFLSTAFFAAIPMIGRQYNQSLTAMAGAERVFKLLDTEPDWTDDPRAHALPPVAGAVAFEQLVFEYEPERPVLRQVSLEAEAGQTIALVGATGSGKTTLVSLIAKLYLPTAGRLTIDGHDIRDITSDSLHRQIACVTQDNFLFTGSVLDNIRVGRDRASDEEVRESARALGVLDLIEALPQGFATLVGEKGVGLSLGQRQILCFCRAMLADPRILILDEATSSVDTVTEARIQAALAKLLAGRTSFVVAHRLSTIRHADQVIVLDAGEIIERGTHQQLLAQQGKYADMYRQFVSASELPAETGGATS